MSKGECATLNSGHKMPRIGLGTWKNPENVEKTVLEAIKLGFRHFDTAPDYKTEAGLGKALQTAFKENLVKREELFITTKFEDHSDVANLLTASLKELQLDYVDLYLIHWPISLDEVTLKPKPQTPFYKVWAALEAEVKAGRVRSIGVSNFNVQTILDLLSYAEIKPAINQVELHPYLVQEELIYWCKKQGIEITAYSPLGGNLKDAGFEVSSVLDEPLIKELAEKYKKTPGQIVLNWHLRRGYTLVPKTSKVERLGENFEVDTFELSDEDVKKITKLNKNARSVDPLKMWDLPCFH